MIAKSEPFPPDLAIRREHPGQNCELLSIYATLKIPFLPENQILILFPTLDNLIHKSKEFTS
ncbi:MAG: hypothetical protein B6245_10020 [Desulfobacteraceae bacterium 4572_88]|nr:MAG: hypothetical protein B6245_10020 [Desulfobacteraceae bacterium 4572_88]